jgi:hypothetical protein
MSSRSSSWLPNRTLHWIPWYKCPGWPSVRYDFDLKLRNPAVSCPNCSLRWSGVGGKDCKGLAHLEVTKTLPMPLEEDGCSNAHGTRLLRLQTELPRISSGDVIYKNFNPNCELITPPLTSSYLQLWLICSLDSIVQQKGFREIPRPFEQIGVSRIRNTDPERKDGRKTKSV